MLWRRRLALQVQARSIRSRSQWRLRSARGLPIADPVASTVVDIGGGTTEVAVISLGSMVVWRSLPVGGYEMDDAIVGHVRRQHSLEIGEGRAEQLKIEIGSAWPVPEESEAEANGRDPRTGRLRRAVVSAQEARQALETPVMQVIDAVRETLERTPPELSADISERGIVLAGGGVLLRGFPERLRAETGLPVHVAEEPLDLRRARGRSLPRRTGDDRPVGQRGQTERAPRRWTVAVPMIAEARALSRCGAVNTESGAHVTGSTTTSAPSYPFA